MGDSQETVRMVQPNEVLELVEGPRKEVFNPCVRLKGKAVSDDAIGWFTTTDSNGAVHAEPDQQYYSCTIAMAITDKQDVKECKVLRKLMAGECFTVLEGPLDDKDSGIIRVKG